MLPSLVRHPRLALASLVLIGLVLRTWGITTNSMTHYDEFYYAQSGLDLWIVSSGAAGHSLLPSAGQRGPSARSQPVNGLHPMLAFHAPPLYPILIALVHAFMGGPWYPAAALVSALVGTATIPLMYVFGKRVGQGEVAGLVAAALLALSDFHVAYSRMALTDVTFCFFFVAALYFLARVFEGGRWLWAVPAGVAAGAAWNVKYNGWMPLAIALTAWLVVFLRARCPPSRPLAASPPRRLWAFALAASMALVLFLPWFFYVQRYFPGGYASVAGHHASFSAAVKAWQKPPPGVGGVLAVARGWYSTAYQLLEALPAFRHWGWCLALGGGAVIAVSLLGRAFAPRQEHVSPSNAGRHSNAAHGTRTRLAQCAALAFLGAAALYVGLDELLLLVGLAVAVVCLVAGKPLDVLVAVWLGAFVVSVPAYHAYPRLLVPALPAAILMLLRGWQWTMVERGGSDAGTSVPRPVRGAALALCVMALIAGSHAAGRFNLYELRGVWSCWSSKKSYRAFAGTVSRSTPPQAWIVCRSQPILWYALPREFKGLDDQPLPGSNDLPAGRPAYLALDFHVHMTPDALESIQSAAGRLEEVARVPNDLTPPAMLNLTTPAEFWPKMRALGTPATLTPEARFLPPELQHPGVDWIILYRIANSSKP